MEGDKRYRFTLRWGQATETDDTEGQVTAESGLRPEGFKIALDNSKVIRSFRAPIGGIVDALQTKIAVNPDEMETNTDWSPFDGWELAGFARTTMSRGEVIVDDYKVVGKEGRGQWLSREFAGMPGGQL